MFSVGQKVDTKYGQGIIICVGAVKPHIYVRVDSRSTIYMLNELDVTAVEANATVNGAERVSASGINSASSVASLITNKSGNSRGNDMKNKRAVEQTPLSIFVRDRLAELGMRQSEFCRLNGFDQGLLSRIQSSMITNLSLESTLRLAIGLSVSPKQILGLIGRMDLHHLIMRAYSGTSDEARYTAGEVPPQVVEISHMAMRVHQMGHNLAPALNTLSSMISGHGERATNYLAGEAQGGSG